MASVISAVWTSLGTPLASSLVVGLVAVIVLKLRLVYPSFPVPPKNAGVLITGASQGIGKAFACDLAKKGYTVFGTVRKPVDGEDLKKHGVRPIIMDVTKPEQVASAAIELRKQLDTLGVPLQAVVNNAGLHPGQKEIEQSGALITTADHYDLAFSANVVGMARVTEALLPMLQARPGGRIVNIGSYFGDLAPSNPVHTHYAASKFAVEGVSDGWRRILRKKEIAVSLIKPGNFATSMNESKDASSDLSPLLSALHDAISGPRPLPRYYVGAVLGIPMPIFSRLYHFLPEWITDKYLS